MANTIKLKRGSGSNPSASDLSIGEVALRTDGNPKLFTKNDAGNVLEVGAVESGSITSTQILDGTIVNADINASAAIAGTKISPDFGTQSISTTGTVTSGSAVLSSTFPNLSFTDADHNSDFRLEVNSGQFKIVDTTNSADRLIVQSDGTIDVQGNLDANAGLDVTGGITASSTGNASLILDAGTGSQAGDQVSFIDFKLDGTLKANIAVNEATSGNPLEINSAGTGATKLFNAGSEKLATFSGGISVTGQVNSDGSHMGDSDKALFGNSNDLQIYHTGSHGYIDNNTGSLRIRDAGGAEKLKVHGTGVTVTGTCTATTFSGSGASLTNIPASQLTGTLPALDGSNLTGLTVDNAQTLDNLDSTQFLRSDQTDTLNGILVVGGSTVSGNEGGEVQFTQSPNGSLSGSTVNVDVNTNNLRIFESGGNTRGFYLDLNSASNYAGGKIFHNGNDGSGSGLDADTLDGVQGSSYLRSDAADTFSGNLTGSSGTNIKLDSNVGTNNNTAYASMAGYIEFTNDYSDAARGANKIRLQNDGSWLAGFGISANSHDIYTGGNFNFYKSNSTTSFTNLMSLSSTGQLGTAVQGVVWGASNDGSGSGLDADTLDGLQASQFLRDDAEGTLNSRLNLTNSASYPLIIGSSSGMDNARLLLRGSSSPYMRFREGNTDKAYIQWSSSGYLQFVNQESGEILRIKDGNNGLIYDVGGTENKVFHAGNDGSGSGLDADVLRGIGGQKYLTSYNDATGGWEDNNRNFRVTTGGNSAGLVFHESDGTFAFQLYGDGSNYGFLDGNWASWDIQKAINGAFKVDEGNGLYRVWNAGNDGSGSGLDSDTVDGLSASQFIRSDDSDTITKGSTWVLTHSLADWGFRFSNGNGSNAHIYMCHGTHGMHIRNDSAGTSQYLLDVYANNGNRFRVRGGDAYTTINGNAVWHAGNDGSGSGLDSDTVDGLQASNFVRSDTSDTMNGELNMAHNQNRQIVLNRNISSPSNYYNGLQMEVRATSGTAGIGLHRNGYSHCGIYHDGSGSVKFNMNNGTATLNGNSGTLWGSSNDGSGSGLDADVLDGLQASSFLRSDANDNLGGVLSYHSNDARLQFRNTSYNTYLYIGGWSSTNSNGISRIRNSNDNLHIDCGAQGSLYLNHYSSKTTYAAHVSPKSNNTYDLGGSSNRWRNLYINDLNLSNEGHSNDVDGTWGSYTIQEGAEDLYLLNKRNGKKYKFNLTEVN